MNGSYFLFIDFDGTITDNDVGCEMFKRFTHGETEPIVRAYRQGVIGSHQCLIRECHLWNRYSPAPDAVMQFIDRQSIATGFREFLALQKQLSIETIVLSEGLDFYIDRILRLHRLGSVRRITNRAVFVDGKLYPEFPYFELGCKRCSNCKAYHIRAIRPVSSCAIYVGDGHSDLHAAEAADVVFAKADLATLLKKKGQAFIEYIDFYDLATKLTQIVRRGIFAISQRVDFRCRPSGEQQRSRNAWGKSLSLMLEDKSGHPIGEATLHSPNSKGCCSHDVRLLAGGEEKGLELEIWKTIVKLSGQRWPDARLLVTPAVDDSGAIEMFASLGFRLEGRGHSRNSPTHHRAPAQRKYCRMVKD